MRITKTLALAVRVLITIVMLGLHTFARVQDAQQPAPPQAASKMPPGHESVAERLESMSKELNLTQEQREKIRPVLEEHSKQMRELRNDTSLTPEQKRDKTRAMMMETHEKIATVLTPEQKGKLKQHMEQMRQQREAHQKEPQPNQ